MVKELTVINDEWNYPLVNQPRGWEIAELNGGCSIAMVWLPEGNRAIMEYVDDMQGILVNIG